MRRPRRRGAGVLLVLLALIAGLLVAADLTARRVAEDELAKRVAARVPEASSTSAKVRSFLFLGRLLTSGKVAEVDAGVTDVTVRGLRFASVGVALHGVKIDRRQLVRDRRVVLSDIDRGRARAEVDAAALAAALGVPVTLEPGRASVTVGGVKLGASLAVTGGRLIVGGVGVTLPGLELVAPLLPCVPDAAVEAGRVVLTCDFTEIPNELRVDVQL
ncbi:MAG: LmeA family phospholipid-binding protein [Acidimicrobiales bacterium]